MAITFDTTRKHIVLDTTTVDAAEIWSAWVRWHSGNTEWPLAFTLVGGIALGGGLFIPPYFFLLSGWRVRPLEGNQNLLITGNLFVEGGGVPVVQTLGTYQVNVNYTVPVQAQGISTAGSVAPTAEQNAAAVWAHATGTAVAVRLAEAWGRLGLDPSKPLVSGQTEISFGDIAMALTGNETSSTLTRQ